MSLGRSAMIVAQLVAHFLGGDVDVLFELNWTKTCETPSLDTRAQLFDPADGIDRFLDRIRNVGLHLIGSGARQSGHHHDRRELDLGEAIHAEVQVPDDAEHQRH